MTASPDQTSELPDRSAMAFGIAEYQGRIRMLSRTLIDQNIDIYLGTTPENLNYFGGFDPLGLYFYQQIFYAPGDREPAILTHKCEKELARTQCWISEIMVWEHGQNPVDITVSKLKAMGVTSGSRVGVEMDNWYLKSSTYQQLVQTLPGVEFVDITIPILQLRSVKSPAEIALMRQAAHYSDLGMSAAVQHLRPGIREVDLLAEIQSTMTRAGSEYPTLPFIIGSGPRSGLFHGLPTTRVIEDGDPVMIELTGVARRYNSNIVRTLVAGGASPLVKELWKVTTDAFWRAFGLVRPGASVAEIDRASRDARREYSDFIPARAGFGMGIAYPPVWAGFPDILVNAPDVLEEGMVFSLEPSVGQFQDTTVIYGYNILVTKTGAEILQKTPADTFEIPY